MTTTELASRKNVITKFVGPFINGTRAVVTFHPRTEQLEITREDVNGNKDSYSVLDVEPGNWAFMYDAYATHPRFERWEMSD